MKAVSVAAFNSRGEAEALCARLEAAGIQAGIENEVSPSEVMEFARPSAGVRVVVARDDFEAALQVVYDWNAAGVGGAQAPLEWLAPGAGRLPPSPRPPSDPAR